MAPDPLQALLGAGLVPSLSFPPTSRYAGVGIATHVRAPGPGQEPVPIAYLRRRLVPRPDRFTLLYEVMCVEGDRRDLLAVQHLADAELWWRLADANGVIDPARMAEPVGRVLRVTLPEGVPGGGGG
jgi:hypothetical protein